MLYFSFSKLFSEGNTAYSTSVATTRMSHHIWIYVHKMHGMMIIGLFQIISVWYLNIVLFTIAAETPKPRTPTPPPPEIHVDETHEEVIEIVNKAVEQAEKHPINLSTEVHEQH